jgi:AraC-like DNA-binding protein
MKVSQPLAVSLPESGVFFAESVHAQDFRMTPRTDAFHKLVYVLRGRVRLSSDGPVRVAGTGALLLIPSRVRHELEDEMPSTLLLLCLSEPFLRGEPELAAWWAEWSVAARRKLQLTATARGPCEALWRRALLERSHGRPAGRAAIRAVALELLVQLARLPRQPAAEDASSRVLGIARAVRETFFDRWSLDEAAERAGMSRRQFTTQFRAVTGETFWEFLTTVRLEHAAQLLRKHEHSVAGVVFACGFGDVSQFYRLFRSRFGVTPGAYRGNENTG